MKTDGVLCTQRRENRQQVDRSVHDWQTQNREPKTRTVNRQQSPAPAHTYLISRFIFARQLLTLFVQPRRRRPLPSQRATIFISHLLISVAKLSKRGGEDEEARRFRKDRMTWLNKGRVCHLSETWTKTGALNYQIVRKKSPCFCGSAVLLMSLASVWIFKIIFLEQVCIIKNSLWDRTFNWS